MTKESRRLPLTDWQIADSDRLKQKYQEKRASLNLTQEKLAAALGEGVTQGAVSHFMNKRTALSIRAVTVFARLLEVPISEISPTLAAEVEKMAGPYGEAEYQKQDLYAKATAGHRMAVDEMASRMLGMSEDQALKLKQAMDLLMPPDDSNQD